MQKHSRFHLPSVKMICAALCAAFIMSGGPALCQEPIVDQVRCYTTWDASYFYLGFKADDPDVRATHRAPNADVSGDDLIEIYVESDNAGAEKITPACFSMAVTAAGGSQCRAGTENGAFDPVAVYTFKYGATVQGTINNSDDIDMGCSIEIAIPWSILKRPAPNMGDQMGFNVIVRRAGDKSSLVSLSPRVKTEDDALNPSKWVKVVFAAHSFGVATTSAEKILSAKYVVRSPLVEGIVGDKEWHQNTSFSIVLPMPEGFVYEAKFPPQRTIFAVYDYDYFNDSRKTGPLTDPNAKTGEIELADHPVKHAGPWFSYDRVQFHKEQLSDMVEAGVDVALPTYRGDKTGRFTYARKGLDCLVAAISELKSEGKPYPMVGMLFDTSGLLSANGGKSPDLKNKDVQRAFYGMIKDFYQRVPIGFRALVQAGKPNAGRAADIVFISGADSFSEMDSGFIKYCNEAYERDFGRPLVWIAPGGFKGKVDGYDGIATFDAGKPGTTESGERISVGVVSPGMDNTARADTGKGVIRSREGGAAYAADWEAVMKANPHWVVCNSWTGFSDGSDLGSSREYDRKYVDATHANVDRFLGNHDFDAQYLSFSVPKVIPSKTFAQAEVTIRNIGNSPWRVSDGYALAYRWYKSGRYYGESKVRRPLERDVMPGRTVSVTIGIATVNVQGAEMPEGDCELRFELIRLSDNKWFSAIGDQPLLAPVTIGKTPEWDASWVSCDAPVIMAAGKPYSATIRVRNDGSEPWRKGVVKLGCKLFKVANFTLDNPTDLNEEVSIKQISAVLDKDCKPGEIGEFAVNIELARSDKKPLEAWKQNDDWSCQLRFDVYNGQQWLSEANVRTLDRVIEVIENDYGPRLVDCDLPTKLIAGQTYDVKVVVRNMGSQTWDRKRTKLGYHWYYVDGAEMEWDGPSVPMKLDLTPGLPAVVLAQVKAPDHDGQYVLVWDVMIDGKWLSLEPQGSGGDVLPVFVEVTGGKLAFVDISALCDISAVSPDTERNAGDFDGAGSSFPSEYFPPDTGPGQEPCSVYPSGYACGGAAQPAGRVSFLYPDKSPGAKNALSCKGQKIDVEDGAYTALHILGASIDGTQAGELTLAYPDGQKTAQVRMYDWGAAPQSDARPALLERHRHTHGGDDISKTCNLHDYTIPLDSSKALTEIKLPANPSMRIVAITLERAVLPPHPAEAEVK